MTFDVQQWLGRPLFVPTWVLFVVAAGGLVVVTASWLRRPSVGDGRVLHRIGGDLGLRPADRRLVRRLATAAGIPTASSLLLSRGCFDRAATAYAASHGWNSRIDRIRTTLFETGANGV